MRFKPSSPEGIRARILETVHYQQPLQLAIIWGAGGKDWPGKPEEKALGILSRMKRGVDQISPQKSELHMILADSHATLNNPKSRDSLQYLAAMEGHAWTSGFIPRYMREICNVSWQEWRNIDIGNVIKSEAWPLLLASSAKHYKGSDVEEGARNYVQLRLAENPFIEQAFGKAIFLTFNGPKFDILMPKLPIIHIVPNDERTGDKPWFALD